ncbi:FliH/SctL family protein [Xanthomonas sp. NCPPB 3005]|uniref:FliH/SctL family protein n=1 Tax=Xanthomonas sp. NCPPB 3005 TaxID=3240913 RepID=UPI00351198A2
MKRSAWQEGLHQPWHAARAAAMDASSGPSADDSLQEAFAAASERGYREGWAAAQQDAAGEIQREIAAASEQLRAGADEERERLAQTRRQLEALFDGLTEAIDAQARSAQEVAVEVSYAAVAKVVGEQYAKRSLMQSICQQAVQTAKHRIAAVRLSPQDAVLELADLQVDLIADPALSAGQCVIETAAGHHELGLDVRLEALKLALLAGFAAHVAEGGAS